MNTVYNLLLHYIQFMIRHLNNVFLLITFCCFLSVDAQNDVTEKEYTKKKFSQIVKKLEFDTSFNWDNEYNNYRKIHSSFRVLDLESNSYGYIIKDLYYTEELNTQIIYFVFNDSLRYAKHTEKVITENDTLTWESECFFKSDTIIDISTLGHRYWNSELLDDNELNKKILEAFKKTLNK